MILASFLLSLLPAAGGLASVGAPVASGGAAATGTTDVADTDRKGRPGVARAHEEIVEDFGSYVAPTASHTNPKVQLERITTGVPWPRGLVLSNGQLVALARGRHRNAGGIDPTIQDHCGALFVIDPNISEPVIRGEQAGVEVRTNAQLLIQPDPSIFNLYDPSKGPPIEANEIDRPYCTLAWDAASQNYFICGYSGVDLPKKRFRKNATDCILRFDLRNRRWHTVERHDASIVPDDDLTWVVPNRYYPHHDPETNPAPHGWLNGPDGATITGRYLYALAKDNHSIVAYDLAEIRENPDAPAPPSRPVLGIDLEISVRGELRRMQGLGPSAVVADETHLYVGYRTSSTVLRFPLDEEGALVQPVRGELIAAFTPWRAEVGYSGNLIDLAFDHEGRLYAALAERGRVWNIGVPNPEEPFNGIDEGDEVTTNEPYVDLPLLTGNPRARTGNIVFDDEGNLYLCSGNYENGTRIAGVVYRAVAAQE